MDIGKNDYAQCNGIYNDTMDLHNTVCNVLLLSFSVLSTHSTISGCVKQDRTGDKEQDERWQTPIYCR
jgi:hypothetical protein